MEDRRTEPKVLNQLSVWDPDNIDCSPGSRNTIEVYDSVNISIP